MIEVLNLSQPPLGRKLALPHLQCPPLPRLQELIGLFFVLLVLGSNLDSAQANPAANIYQQKCASCHGDQGQGVDGKYKGPLFGDDSLDDLTERISGTMPEDNPEDCVGEEARQVAEYIYQEFYSLQARREKGLIAEPRIELSRLTVPQYRNIVADLLTLVAPSPERRRKYRRDMLNAPGGLKGEYYYSSKKNKTDDRRMIRVDPYIDFDFSAGSPAESIPSKRFAIIWQGTLHTRKTGHYEFRIRSENGFRFYLNSDGLQSSSRIKGFTELPERLIDEWVSSGEMRAISKRMFLLGGRNYPIRVEFFKYNEPTASIRLEWKPPGGVWSVLDQQSLRLETAPRTFVVNTPFPPDDRSLGYERGSSVSQEWYEAVTRAALETSEEVIQRLPKLAGINPKTKDRKAQLADFIAKLATTAFRRPLTKEEDTLFRQTLFESDTPEIAVRRAVLLILTSPHFLYTDLTPKGESPTQHAIAARLALTLWDSLPDKELRQAADAGQLHALEQIGTQTKRMMADPRSKAKLHGFFQHWLELEDRDLAKDQQLFPNFDEAVIADLRQSLELFIDEVVWGKSSDYRQLLQADYLLLNSRLTKLYATPQTDGKTAEPQGSSFQKIKFAPKKRSGILTHPYLLSALAYHNNTSPIHRGVFLTRNIIGRQLKPPPVAVAFKDNEFAPDLTMREKITELTRDQACMSCHEVINPLGFALENYDAIGRLRTIDNNKPIDTRGDITSAEGKKHTITSARDIADFAVKNPAAHRAFVSQLFQYLVQQDPTAYNPELVQQLQQEFAKDNFHIQRMIVRIAAHVAAYRPATTVPTTKIPTTSVSAEISP